MVTPAKPRAASRVELDGADDLVEVVADLDGAVGEAGAAHAALAQHLVERLRVRAMVCDRGRRVFQLVTGQDTHHALAWFDGALLPKSFQSGDARGRGGFATQATGADFRLG